MRRVVRPLFLALVLALGSIVPAAAATPPRVADLTTREALLNWLWAYRAKPSPASAPALMRQAAQIGALRDPEASGVYVGFLAGVLSTHAASADDIVGKILPLPAEDQWAVVRAIAYSGIPDWKGVLGRAAHKMPTRRAMIDKLIAGKLPTLDSFKIDKEPTWSETTWSYVRVDKYFAAKPPKEVKVDPSPDLIDTFWGRYFATGAYEPIHRLITMLPWTKHRDSLEKLTLGSMAKYTLATNAARDASLLATLKWAAPQQPKEIAAILTDVIDAAETVETARIRKELLAAMEELKRKGPGSRRDVAWWGKLGEGAISLGCLGAAVAGQVELGIPCVVGGALSSATLRYWAGE